MNTETLVKDIYQMIDTKEIPDGVDVEQAIETFGENVKNILRNNITEHEFDRRKLRMSNIGKKDRQLWYSYNGYKGEKLMPHTRIKFLYGHLIEEMVLALAKLSGHEVTDTQKKAEVDGIKGSMDCKIDGIVTDVKSSSPYGFKKFKDGSLINDDPFGYIGQISAYAEANGLDEAAFLAIDKSTGEICLSPLHSVEMINARSRIKHLKEIISNNDIPDRCYSAVPDRSEERV